VADYHIRDFSSNEETLKLLIANPPQIIVVLPEAEEMRELQTFIADQYVPIKTIDGATVWYNTTR
jgi:hypothetical protein